MVALAQKGFADRAEEILLMQDIGPGLRLLSSDEILVNHFFAPGLYARSLARRAGAFIVGHRHKKEHMNILLSGRLRIYMDGAVTEVAGPSMPFISKAGVRKATLALEDSVLITFHPTEETDLDKLEEELIEKSPLFQELEGTGIIAKLRGETLLS